MDLGVMSAAVMCNAPDSMDSPVCVFSVVCVYSVCVCVCVGSIVSLTTSVHMCTFQCFI